jgi:YfiH family protein
MRVHKAAKALKGRSIGLLRQDADGLVTYRFESLPAEGGQMGHAVFTRQGGVSQPPFATLNVGTKVGDDEAAVAENHTRIFSHLGLNADRVVTAQQVHGNRVGVVTADDAGRVFAATDGLITGAADLALLLRFADCQPILLYDPVHHALGLVHAGWRGIAQGIARRAVEMMHGTYGTEPGALIAALGPAIGPCCYTVRHKAASALAYALPDWRQVMQPDGEQWQFDLPAANGQQLEAIGVRSVEQAHLCTACHKDVFFSHRGEHGRTGRFAVMAYLSSGDGEESPRETNLVRKEQEPEAREGQDLLQPPGFPAFHDLASGEL